MNRKFTILALAAISAVACKKTGTDPVVTPPPPVINKIAPDGFTYQTTKQVSINIQLLGPDNTPLAGVPVSLYNNVQVLENGNVDEKGALFTGLSDKNGNVTGMLMLPVITDTVLVDAKYTGLVRNAKTYISGGVVTATIGGANGVGGNVVVNQFSVGRNTSAGSTVSSFGQLGGTTYISMGNTDNSGRPKYLVSPSDVISTSLLSFINASLPESKPLPTTHPQYLTDNATGTISIVEASEVWVTFVSEGAGNVNSLGFYTYPTATPPATAADITSVSIMFPNASLFGSGGTMRSGDKISLGKFDAGTSVGFVLFANGWAGGNAVNTSGTKFYSDTKLNPETDASLKKHSVLLNDTDDKLYLIGFEDVPRNSASCDQDFNDAVFYTSANPITAISTTNVLPIDKPTDSDGDGVTDVFDQYPKDATRAYNNYYPSQNTYGTLAFEDLWPATGDYDMNDLVVNYRYNYVTNALNQVVELYGDYAVQAAGASFQNGFGVQFPFAPALIKQVTGQKTQSGYIKLAANGVEAGQAKAVIIPFDNHQDLINNFAGAYFINTKNELPKVTGDTAHVYVQFAAPITIAALGTAPFNPFLISNQHRDIEIHLPGNAPTDLANLKLLGTGDDASSAAKGIYYVSTSNWPWALNFPGTFTYPLEGTSINKAYLHFLEWAKSGGTSYTDWFSNPASDYRDINSLYTK